MRKVLAYVTAAVLIIMFACSNRDDRNNIRDRYGEPNEKQSLGKEIFWRELWFYSASGTGYEFRRNAGCGSYHDVYLYSSFFFQPDTSGATSLQKNLKVDPNVQQELSSEPRDRIVAPY